MGRIIIWERGMGGKKLQKNFPIYKFNLLLEFIIRYNYFHYIERENNFFLF